jgi:hypothetical protein
MTFLGWLAADPVRYAVVSDIALFAFAVVAVCGMFSGRADAWLSRRSGTLGYLALAASVLLAARWPTLFVRDPLNQDEAQALAQAITALHDPIPWGGFDPNTAGPLNTYALTLPALFGLHLSFLTTRVIALLLEFGAIVTLYASAAICFDAALGRVAIVPAVAFFSLATEDHFVHYSGELVAIFLGMLMLAALCAAYRRAVAPGWMFVVGLAGGMMPFAKLQSVPLAALTVVIAVAVVLLASPAGTQARVARLGALGAGLLCAPTVVLSVTAAGGSLRDFWLSYIQTSLAYILYQDQPLSFVTATPEFGPLFDVLLAVAGLGAVALAARYAYTSAKERGAFAAAVVVLVGALWAIFAPKRGSLNYLLFGILPAAGAAAAAIGIIVATLRLRSAGLARGALALAFIGACLAAMSAFTRSPYPYLGAFAGYVDGRPDPVTALIAAHVKPGERLAIWGWRPQYFVTTYTLMGTRDAITQYQYSPNFNPYFNYFRQRYVHDLEADRPVAFLDTGPDSFDFEGKGRFGYEMFPQLAQVIERDYRLVGSVHGIRLFVRRDRL